MANLLNQSTRELNFCDLGIILISCFKLDKPSE